MRTTKSTLRPDLIDHARPAHFLATPITTDAPAHLRIAPASRMTPELAAELATSGNTLRAWPRRAFPGPEAEKSP